MTRRSFAGNAIAAAAGMVLLPGATSAQGAEWTGSSSLKARAAARGLLSGMAVNMGRLDRDATYTRTVVEQCSIVVAENAMKWGPLRPAPDRFDFTEADRFVSFAANHGIEVRGHNLCWHQALPPWFAGAVNQGNAQQVLTGHITTVAGRYQGRVRAWDVVNEAVEPRDGRPDGLRHSPWLALLGPGYIEMAFRAARAADRTAMLTYNEYGIETDGPEDAAKRKAVLALLRHLRDREVPIDAMGIQSHLSAGSAGQIGDGLSRFLEDCAELGLKVFATELDVNDDDLAASETAARTEQVGAIYRNYGKLLLKNPAVTDLLCWGVENRSSWLNSAIERAKLRPKHPDREEVCLLFDDGFQPQPAFFAMRDAFRSRKV